MCGRNFVHHEGLLLLLFELNWRCPHSVVKTKVIAGITLGLCAQRELGERIGLVSHLLPHSIVWLGSVGCNFLHSFFDELVAHRTLLICHGAHYATVNNVLSFHTWLKFKLTLDADAIVIGLLSDKLIFLTRQAHFSHLLLCALRHPYWHGKRVGNSAAGMQPVRQPLLIISIVKAIVGYIKVRMIHQVWIDDWEVLTLIAISDSWIVIDVPRHAPLVHGL